MCATGCVADDLSAIGADTFAAFTKDFTWEVDFTLMDTFRDAGAVIALPTVFGAGTLHTRVFGENDGLRATDGVFVDFPIAIIINAVADLFCRLTDGWAPDGVGTGDKTVSVAFTFVTLTEGFTYLVELAIYFTSNRWRGAGHERTGDASIVATPAAVAAI